MNWLFARLSEASTWAGIAAIVTPAVGVAAGAVTWQGLLATALPAALAIVTKEVGK